MNFKSYINAVYHHRAPDAENGSPSAGGSGQEGETEDPGVMEEDSPTTPEADNLWHELSKEAESDDDDLESSPSEATPVVPEPEVPAKPEVTPEAESPAEVEPTAADTAVPTEPAERPTTEPEPEPIPQRTEQELAQEREARATQMKQALASRFAITDDEALQLVTDPGKAFPELQARMFTDMWLHVEALIDQRLPQVIESTTRVMKIRDEKVNDFFQKWPQLDRVKHGKQVAQVAQVFSQVNKNATDEEVIRNVGMQVMLMNGITPEMRPVQQGDTPTVADEPPVTPYRPTTVNGARAPQRSSDNLFEAMSYELEEDED